LYSEGGAGGSRVQCDQPELSVYVFEMKLRHFALTNRDCTHMGQRGSNAFKRNDAIRALQSARDGGLEPAMMEASVSRSSRAASRPVTF
jgi:hypothetical protein